MSAFATLVRPDRAFLWTDGAIGDFDSVLRKVARKCFKVAGERMVVTGRGPENLPRIFAARLAQLRVTPDDLRARGEEITDEFFEDHAGFLDSLPASAADLCIVGWLEAEAAPIVALRTTEPADDGLHFTFGKEFCAPGLTEKEAKRFRLRLGRVTLADVDPEHYGVTLMEGQRRVPGDEKFGLGGVYVVGGHCLQTEVSSAGVTHRIIHTWPDKIGQRIDPLAQPAPRLSLASKHRSSTLR